jgi:peptidyl-prolyl cis-trans isomerase C
MNRALAAAVAAAVGLVVGLVVPRPWERGPLGSEAHGQPVAIFSGGAVGADDLAQRAAAQPPSVRAMLAAPAQRKTFVENLVKFELLAQEAIRRGYERDPAFVQKSKQRLGQILLEKEVEKPLLSKAPTEGDVRKYFNSSKAALSRPERVRIAAISFAAPQGDPSGRATKRAAAEAALADVKTRAKDYYAFGEIAHARTEDVSTRAANGELPFLSAPELSARYGEALADAAFALRESGAIHDGVVETPVGFHVVKLLGREPGYEPRFDEVKEQIRQRLVGDARATALKKYLDALWQRYDVSVDEKALQTVKLD